MVGGEIVPVLGVDFGTDSVRALIVDSQTGRELSSGVAAYPRWAEGQFCDPVSNQYRQHPLDHIEALIEAIVKAVKNGSIEARTVRAMCIDSTGSTPAPTDKVGRPLVLRSAFAEDPDAMFYLWKDHSAIAEAEEISRAAKAWSGPDFTEFVGGTYSSEWYWAKALWSCRNNPCIAKATTSWVEHCDWITGLLVENLDPAEIRRSRCAAGHKAMWNDKFGGLPDTKFFESIDSRLGKFRQNANGPTYTSDQVAGRLSIQWASRLRLPAGIPVAVGLLDAHAAAVGAGIRPGVLVRVMGTSTCDMAVANSGPFSGTAVRGISGQVQGSIIPGLIGFEAGQSAFGDLFSWFQTLISWSPAGDCEKARSNALLSSLGEAASMLDPGETREYALDWHNGRRSPYADFRVSGALAGLTLSSNAPRLYRAIVEAAAFGSKEIVEHLSRNGVEINETVAVGGVAKKSSFVMQTLSDVLGMPISVRTTEQPAALGAAMLASVAAGINADVSEAQEKMLKVDGQTDYSPNAKNESIYASKFGNYRRLADFENMARKSLESHQ